MRVNSLGNNVGIRTTSSQLIDGASTKTLGSQWAYVTVVSDGAGYVIMGHGGTVS